MEIYLSLVSVSEAQIYLHHIGFSYFEFWFHVFCFKLYIDLGGEYVAIGSDGCTHLVVDETYGHELPQQTLKAVHVVKQEVIHTEK